ncbi:MAG: TolC family outer membrane protein [Alphaproteobacteria bacterium]
MMLGLGVSPAHAIDLADAVSTALQTNPDVGIVVEDQRAISEELNQAYSGYYPVIDLRASEGQEWTNNATTRGREQLPGEGDTIRLPSFRSSLSISQTLFDGYETFYEIERQKARTISASRRVRETSEFIALDAIEAYLESLRQRELVLLAEENIAVHQQTLELVKAKAEGGAATVADIQQTESRLAAAEATLTEAQSRLKDADATYIRIIGETPTSLERPIPPLWALPNSVEAAIDTALENNPTIAVNRADVAASRAEYNGSKSTFLPTVELEVNGSADRNQEGVRGGEYIASALVTVNYNLFNGFEDYHTRKELMARIGESRQRLNRAIRLTEEEMRLAWNARTSAQERVGAQTREAEANDQVRQTYRQQFDLGGRNLLELLDAENELFITRGNLISSEFAELFAAYRILATGGILVATLDSQILKESQHPEDPIPSVQIDLEPSLAPPDLESGLEGNVLDPAQDEGISDDTATLDTETLPDIDDPAPIPDNDILESNDLYEPDAAAAPSEEVGTTSTDQPPLDPDADILAPEPGGESAATDAPADRTEDTALDTDGELSPDLLDSNLLDPELVDPSPPEGEQPEPPAESGLSGLNETETPPAGRDFRPVMPELNPDGIEQDPLNPFVPDRPDGEKINDDIFNSVSIEREQPFIATYPEPMAEQPLQGGIAIDPVPGLPDLPYDAFSVPPQTGPDSDPLWRDAEPKPEPYILPDPGLPVFTIDGLDRLRRTASTGGNGSVAGAFEPEALNRKVYMRVQTSID